MKKLTITLALILITTAGYACTAFLTGEQVSGMNKICYYDHLGSTVATTIRNIDLCPLSIHVPH